MLVLIEVITTSKIDAKVIEIIKKIIVDSIVNIAIIKTITNLLKIRLI